jgi:cytoplasmic iron level regulating protein YaaA (DUF328/UPF0246 family)
LSQSSINKKICKQVLTYFDGVDVSTNYDSDFSKVIIDRSTKEYENGLSDYDLKSDSYKVKGLYAKKARGYMCKFIVKNKIDTLADLLSFNEQGYSYNSELSNHEVITFTRKAN